MINSTSLTFLHSFPRLYVRTYIIFRVIITEFTTNVVTFIYYLDVYSVTWENHKVMKAANALLSEGEFVISYVLWCNSEITLINVMIYLMVSMWFSQLWLAWSHNNVIYVSMATPLLPAGMLWAHIVVFFSGNSRKCLSCEHSHNYTVMIK